MCQVKRCVCVYFSTQCDCLCAELVFESERFFNASDGGEWMLYVLNC